MCFLTFYIHSNKSYFMQISQQVLKKVSQKHEQGFKMLCKFLFALKCHCFSYFKTYYLLMGFIWGVVMEESFIFKISYHLLLYLEYYVFSFKIYLPYPKTCRTPKSEIQYQNIHLLFSLLTVFFLELGKHYIWFKSTEWQMNTLLCWGKPNLGVI